MPPQYPKLRLYYPVKPFFLNQGFGDTSFLSYYANNGVNFKGHNGWDFQAKHGQPVYAPHDGICYPEVDSRQGQGVNLITREQFDYNGKGPCYFKSVLWHLTDDDAVVHAGQIVKAGDLIGYADSTGLSTADHLHYGLKPCNYTEPGGDYKKLYNLEEGNGYYGAIDPKPYWNGLYAQDITTAPSTPNPYKHNFYINMKKGDANSEVLALQRALASIGMFPENVKPTGVYGIITQQAVFAFQRKYVATTFFAYLQVWASMGTNVGPLTLPALNKVFGV